MYSDKDVSGLLDEGSRILGNEAHSLTEAQNDINTLRDIIHFHDYRYYVLSEPIASDLEYDKLYKKLKALEDAYPQLITEDSPTQRVGQGLTKDFPQIAHIVPMLSLDNSYNEEDLGNFDRKVRELAKLEEVIYNVEPKYDGASVSIVYEDDKLLRGATRGDGIIGEDITNNLRVMRSIPLKAAFSSFGIKTIEIRGEVVIQKEKFKEFNKKREEAGLATFANPRNSASGSLRLQDSAEVAKRNLEAVLYHISYAVDAEGNDLLGNKLRTRDENIRMLHKLGFKTPLEEHKVADGIKEVVDFVHEWAEKRDNYKYELDGMVVKVNDISLAENLGATSHHPRWAMAFKFGARQARTRLLNVEYQVGRVGTITPVAKLEPVSVGGVTVSSISMFNEDFIKEKDLRIGDAVLIERAGDVIPYINMSIKDARKGDEEVIVFPTECPSCGSKLIRAEEEAAWRCVNINCPAQVLERLIHFASRDAMEITGLGDAIVRRLAEHGWLKTLPDIYRLPYDEIRALDGFGKRSAEKLQESIEASKNRPLAKLIFGLGIRYVGETTAKVLAENVLCLEEYEDWSEEKITGMEGIGPKVAQSVFDFFHRAENIAMLAELKELGLKLCQEKTESAIKDGTLSGITLLFTGTLDGLGRNEAKKLAEAAGATVAGSLSSKVQYLVVGDDPGSKVDKAKKIGTQVITQQQFMEMLEAGVKV